MSASSHTPTPSPPRPATIVGGQAQTTLRKNYPPCHGHPGHVLVANWVVLQQLDLPVDLWKGVACCFGLCSCLVSSSIDFHSPSSMAASSHHKQSSTIRKYITCASAWSCSRCCSCSLTLASCSAVCPCAWAAMYTSFSFSCSCRACSNSSCLPLISMASKISLACHVQLSFIMQISRSCSSYASLAAISAHCCHTCLDTTSSSDKQCSRSSTRAWSAASCCSFCASCCCIRRWASSFAASCCWRAVSACCDLASCWRVPASLSCCGAGCCLEPPLSKQGCLPGSVYFATMFLLCCRYRCCALEGGLPRASAGSRLQSACT